MTETEVIRYPPELSKDTKRNAHCHQCDVLENSQHYSLCLHKLTLRKSGRLKEDWSECSVAIGKKTCPAIGMREREEIKGYALFFTERVKFTGLASLVNVAKEFLSRPTVAQRKAAGKVVKAQPKHDELDLNIDGGGYQDAINMAKKKAPATMKVEPKAGESLLDMAKRMMANKA